MSLYFSFTLHFLLSTFHCAAAVPRVPAGQWRISRSGANLLCCRRVCAESSGDFRWLSQLRNVELLKLRFGEATLQNCDIMLRDVADSKRANSHVQKKLEAKRTAPVPSGDGWPPYARGRSVRQCLGTVLNEEWAHHGFCVRDLDTLSGREAP